MTFLYIYKWIGCCYTCNDKYYEIAKLLESGKTCTLDRNSEFVVKKLRNRNSFLLILKTSVHRPKLFFKAPNPTFKSPKRKIYLTTCLCPNCGIGHETHKKLCESRTLVLNHVLICLGHFFLILDFMS
jgi:hypothetical protein